MLKKGVSPKWVNVRTAQLVEATQALSVLERLGGNAAGGGGAGKTK